MELHSTKNTQEKVSLKHAVLQGLPPDNGLYMPNEIPHLPASFFEEMPQMSFEGMAFEVCRTLLQGFIPDETLREIVFGALGFDAPLVELDAQTQVLELFHGPTLAFKDFGARFMARLMGYFVEANEKKLTILVATSGDTGGAVASGFLGTEGIEVIILYPSGKVSDLQEKQLTTLGQNITAIEIEGTFDDCQALVKQAFLDPDLTKVLRLSSANSINIARLIPQMFYYFRAWQQLKNPSQAIVAVVPSGNFGNLTAGLIAQKMGLPIAHFIAATNQNNVVPEYIATGHYQSRPSVRTISNAMDVGNPSNFARMQALFGESWDAFKSQVSGYSFDDEATKQAIKEVYDKYGYVIDPHGAIGYLAWQIYRTSHPESIGIILETAHPAKFIDDVESQIGIKVEIPERLAILKDRKKEAHFLSKEFEYFKAFLQGHAAKANA
ncbi:MAG: threonine synthase [Bacteroidia bacterium]